jgi:hypothetical protein
MRNTYYDQGCRYYDFDISQTKLLVACPPKVWEIGFNGDCCMFKAIEDFFVIIVKDTDQRTIAMIFDPKE